MNTTTEVAVAAMNLMDGFGNHPGPDAAALLTDVDGNGMGFLEFTYWLAPIAAHAVRVQEAHQHIEVIGVYHYEVTCEVGSMLRDYVRDHNQLPSEADVCRWIDQHAAEFFEARAV